MLAGDRQHAAGSGRGIVHRPHHAGLGQRVVVFDEQQVDHQPDDFARREVFPGGLVGDFGELANQFLEDGAHLGVADGFGVQVDVGELLGDQIQQPGFGQPVNLRVEVEALEDVPHGRGERLHVGEQVLWPRSVVRKAEWWGPATIAHGNERTPANTGENMVSSVLTGVLRAEDTGLEPAAPYGVPQFQ